MAKRMTPGQVAKEINNILFTFTGKSIRGLIEEGWEKYRQTRIGDATAPLERAARAMDPYAVLGLPKDATIDQVKTRYRQLSLIYHPDKEGGYVEAMKLINNAYEEIIKRG